MKKLFVCAITVLLGASLSFAQTGASTGDKTDKTETKGKKHHHKGGKKSKKGSSRTSSGSTTPK